MSRPDHAGATSRTAPADGRVGQRQVMLPDGRTLTVRASTPADAEGVELLFDGLSADDRHLRFFASYRPPRKFFEHLVSAAQEGGYGMVAVVDDPTERIVAEVDYFLLTNGNAELSITVAADWRGWLGPYLLDALLEARREVVPTSRPKSSSRTRGCWPCSAGAGTRPLTAPTSARSGSPSAPPAAHPPGLALTTTPACWPRSAPDDGTANGQQKRRACR
jgi:hypothetical protein